MATLPELLGNPHGAESSANDYDLTLRHVSTS
jgi:hypothetical protein